MLITMMVASAFAGKSQADETYQDYGEGGCVGGCSDTCSWATTLATGECTGLAIGETAAIIALGGVGYCWGEWSGACGYECGCDYLDPDTSYCDIHCDAWNASWGMQAFESGVQFAQWLAGQINNLGGAPPPG